MKAIGDVEILERLVHADGVMSKMMDEAGLDRWAVMNSMALAFYAMKFDEPEKVLDRHLKVVGDVVRVYGRRMPEWCSLEVLVNFEGFYPGDDEWIEEFMFAQDYLQHVIDLHTRENGGIDDRIIGGSVCSSISCSHPHAWGTTLRSGPSRREGGSPRLH